MKRSHRLLLSLIISIILVLLFPALFLFVILNMGKRDYNNTKSISIGNYNLDIHPTEHSPESSLKDSCLIVISSSAFSDKKDTIVYRSLDYTLCPLCFFVARNDSLTIVGDSIYYYNTCHFLSIQKLNYYEFESLYHLPAENMFFGTCDTVSSFDYAFRLYNADSYIIDYKKDFSTLYRHVYSSEKRYDKIVSSLKRRKRNLGFYSNDSLRIKWAKDVEYYYAIVDYKNQHKSDTLIWEDGPMTVIIYEDTLYVSTYLDRYIYKGAKNNRKLERLFFNRGFILSSEENETSYKRIQVDFYYSSPQYGLYLRRPSRPHISVNPLPAKECNIPLPDLEK